MNSSILSFYSSQTYYYYLCFALLSCLNFTKLNAQCSPDITPPVIGCNSVINVALGANGTADFTAAVASSPDPVDICDGTNLNYLFQLNAEPPTSTLILNCGDIGVNTIKFWASDQSGNTDSCTMSVTVADLLPPSLVCKNFIPPMEIDLPANGEIEVSPWDFLEGAFDNCLDSSLLRLQINNDPPVASMILDCSYFGFNNVSISYEGTTTSCWTVFKLNDPIGLCSTCDPDLTPPVLDCKAALTLGLGIINYYEVSNHDPIDACDGYNVDYLFQLNNETPTDSVDLTCQHIGSNTLKLWVFDQSGNTDSCTIALTVENNQSPNFLCNANVQIELPANGQIEVDAFDFLDPNYTNCLDTSLLRIQVGAGPIVTSAILDCNNIGSDVVRVTYDGFAVNCLADLLVIDPLGVCPSCNPDITPPEINCNAVIQIALGADGTANFTASIASSPDPVDICDGTNLNYLFQLNSEPVTDALELTCDDIGVNTVKFWVSDQSGNTDSCTIQVEVEDQLNPIMICDLNVQIDLPANGEIEVNAWDFMDGSYDNCLDSSLFMIQINDGPVVQSTILDCTSKGSHTVRVSYESSINSCWANFTVNDPLGICVPLSISGKVFADTTDNCMLDTDEDGLANINVDILNLQNNFLNQVSTNADGDYTLNTFTNPGSSVDLSYAISLPDIPTFLLPCGTTQNLTIPAGATSGTSDFPTAFEPVCSLLTVDISTSNLRRCFSNNEYFISYCNYSTFTVESPYIEVVLDDLIEILTSNVAYTGIATNTYRFDLPDLAPGECGTIALGVRLDCAAQLQQTICATAQIYPSENCGSNGAWSGAQIEAESFCNGGDAGFFLRNVGTGDMVETANYLIVEDFVMYMNNPFQLAIGEQIQIDVPANGSTWRLEAPQEQGYPGDAEPIAWLEGCGGINNTGLVTLFPTNNNDLFKSTFCLEVTGSYDPNDKQGFPRGYENEHFIKANQVLDYLIRFQNTGNDTAFTVVIVDTIDTASLQASTIRPGSSSHPYQFEITETGIVTFTFDNILLPDSTTNELASHGFGKFRIQQQADLPEGTVLENQAAIYFDFNDPIITNKTWHTIEFAPITTKVSKNLRFPTSVKVSPNPFSEAASFLVEGEALRSGLLVLHNLRGQAVDARRFTGNQLLLERKDLPAGMYFYTLFEGEEKIGLGKLIIR